MAQPGTDPQEPSCQGLFSSVNCFLLSMGNLFSLVPFYCMGSLVGVTVPTQSPHGGGHSETSALLSALPTVLQLGFTASIVWAVEAQRGDQRAHSS